MATIDLTTDEGGAELAGLEAAARAIGPLRNPDDCVLACPDCTCARLLEQRRGCVRATGGANTGTAVADGGP
jgi:hypothetical protein